MTPPAFAPNAPTPRPGYDPITGSALIFNAFFSALDEARFESVPGDRGDTQRAPHAARRSLTIGRVNLIVYPEQTPVVGWLVWVDGFDGDPVIEGSAPDVETAEEAAKTAAVDLVNATLRILLLSPDAPGENYAILSEEDNTASRARLGPFTGGGGFADGADETPPPDQPGLASLIRDADARRPPDPAVDLRAGLADLRARVTALEPPPGWISSPSWFATDGSGRSISMDVRTRKYGYTDGQGGWHAQVSSDAREACRISDAAARVPLRERVHIPLDRLSLPGPVRFHGTALSLLDSVEIVLLATPARPSGPHTLWDGRALSFEWWARTGPGQGPVRKVAVRIYDDAPDGDVEAEVTRVLGSTKGLHDVQTAPATLPRIADAFYWLTEVVTDPIPE